ncbi:MAG TPA: putative toxin-antitoxin system toxin component, PIN family [Candidatus Babeliales bacterium]|nr:putative toxin-antitoxin system toxin component, PIN family [Candidatus Babeliales bacterium]
MISVCIDANVYISAIAFGGKPAKIVELALLRKFDLVTSLPILDEVSRNLTNKLGFSAVEVNQFLRDILAISSVYEPTGSVSYITHKQDNLVLETALLGNVDVLVTGDKKDLLPLKNFKGIVIEPPSVFLLRLESLGIM